MTVVTKSIITLSKPLRDCLKVLLAALVITLSSLPNYLYGQNALSAQDLSGINVDNLSDSQIEQLLQQAQAAGLSQVQLEQQALQRGLPGDQLQKLEERINKISNSRNPVSGPVRSENVYGRRKSTIGNGNRNNNRIPGPTRIADSLQNPKIQNYDLIFNKIRTRVFGEDLFNNPNLTFEPNLRLPTPRNYILAADDQLSIDIFGYSEATYKLTVSPEGYIRIPNVGPVLVNGLTIEEAKARITKQLSSIYTGMRGSHPTTFVNINLGDIRSIKVVLVGEVKLPGTYTLPSLATVFNALYSSGGPNQNGSFRNIELIRDNRVIEHIDVYDFLLNGAQKQNIRLQDQDVIKINPYSRRVEFRGEVKRPGIYEIESNETFAKTLTYTGGFTDRAYTHRVKVIQADSREKTVYDIPDTQFETFTSHRGDTYLVEPIIDRFSNRVQIQGAVFRPGLYAFQPGLTVSQLIKKADGIREDAFTSRATIRRLNEQLNSEIIAFDVTRIMSGADADIPLQREDSLTITSRFNLQEKYTVSITGEVIHPDTILWSQNLHIQDLVLQAGGLTDAASFKRIDVSRRVRNSDPLSRNSLIAKTFTFNITPDLRSNQDAADFILQPFDEVVIRTLPGYIVQQSAIIIGEIIYGGKYTLTRKNQHISDLVTAAGGLTAEAFPEGATLIRGGALSKFQQDRRRQLLLRLRTSNNSRDSASLSRTLAQDSIAERQATPVGIQLVKILKNPGSKLDLILNDGDTIKIPRKLETVQVSGDVLFPVKIRYDRSFTVSHYINAAGGFSQNAAKRRTYVVYPNGSVRATSRFLFFNNYPSVQPGTQIVVPDKGPIRKTTVAELLGIGTSITSLVLLIYTIFKK